MRSKILLAAVALFLLNVASAQSKITFKDSAYYPEGIVWNAAGNYFFTGSVKTGTIKKVDLAGKTTPFYRDDSLKSCFGMKIDAAKNILWVCTGDPNYSIYKSPDTYRKQARLIAIDIASGKKIKDINLAGLYPGEHFINDIAFDDAGDMYVTDSYSPVIYKVTADGTASVFIQNGLFEGADIGLNGITWNKNGFLITVNNSNGSILKVDLKTKQVSKVKIDQFFPGADGLIQWSDRELILVQNKGVDKIFKITSADNWASAKVISATQIEDRFQNPSTATVKGNNIYVMNAKLNEIEDKTKKPSTEFIIQEAMLKPVM